MRQFWLLFALAGVAYISVCDAFASDLINRDEAFEALDASENLDVKLPPNGVIVHRFKRSDKKGHSSSFDEGGGSKHGEDHFSKKGEKGDKGHKSGHKWDKADKGHHDEEKAAGHHEEKG